MRLRIYDGRDLLVREISSADKLEPGEHRLAWDGKDRAGRILPPEAYVYTLEGTSPTGVSVEYDLTDISGNRELPWPEARYDAGTRTIRYELPVPARVNVRVGLANSGPLLKTVVDWVARTRGAHQEPWDGYDEARVLDASRHPELQITVSTWALPDNAVIVLPAIPEVQLAAGFDEGTPRRAKKREERPKPRAVHQIPIERRRDPRVVLSLPNELPRDADGVVIASGPVTIQMDVDDRDRERLLNQRFEAGFYVDGKFVFENEVGFLPMSWRWDPTGVNEGVHFVTGNIWGYSGQFGTSTVRVRVAR